MDVLAVVLAGLAIIILIPLVKWVYLMIGMALTISIIKWLSEGLVEFTPSMYKAAVMFWPIVYPQYLFQRIKYAIRKKRETLHR